MATEIGYICDFCGERLESYAYTDFSVLTIRAIQSGWTLGKMDLCPTHSKLLIKANQEVAELHRHNDTKEVCMSCFNSGWMYAWGQKVKCNQHFPGWAHWLRYKAGDLAHGESIPHKGMFERMKEPFPGESS